MVKYLLNCPTSHKTDKSDNKVIKSLKYKKSNENKECNFSIFDFSSSLEN